MADAAQPARSGTHHAVLAGFLGWTLDAFDFFLRGCQKECVSRFL
jgi:hypothetical protein